MNGTRMETSKVVQITNICPNINADQMKTFLSFVGRLDQFKLYPERINLMSTGNVTTKVAYAKYSRSEDALMALHLTNTIFIDRALILVPVDSGVIPDEATGMQNAVVGTPGSHNQNQDMSNGQYDTSFQMETDTYEELGRTIYVENLPSEAIAQPDLLIAFFGQIGEVKYIRLAGDEADGASAFVEFSSVESATAALQQSGEVWNGNELRVSRSETSIAKAQLKSNSAAQREIELAMEQVREAETLIKVHASVPTEILPGSINRSALAMRARSRSREVSRSSRRKSPSPRRRRSRTRSPERVSKKRSRSKERRRTKSKTPERRRRRSPSESITSKDRDRDADKRDKDKDRERDKKSLRKDRDSSEERVERKSSKKDRERYSSDEERTLKKKHKKDKKRKNRDSSRSRSREKSSKKNGDSKGKNKKSVSPDNAMKGSPSLTRSKDEPMETSP